ncbi:MAG: sulfatase-like hydrolase/transferase [Candidatus Levybacteria bacterium]|nr:sulfatase-like hydrolase/transferase [Candidatus Levybacteria bacterium]
MKLILYSLKNYYYVAAPFLIAAYTVLFLYVQNQHEYTLSVLITPLVLALLFAALIIFLVRFFTKSLDKNVFLSSFVVLVCLSYGRFVELFKNASFKIGSFEIKPELLVAVLSGLILLGVVVLMYKIKKRFVQVDQLIAVIALLLVGFQVYGIVSFEITSGRISRTPVSTEKIQTKNVSNVTTPDIYYFIFDRYAGPTATSEQYGFDNSAFYAHLEDLGFYVADKSRSNYPKTFLSLGSSLNMEYLDFITEQTNGGASKDESLVTPLMENSKVLKFLKDNGYSYVHVGSWWEQTKGNKNADYLYAPKFDEYLGADEFTTGFFNTTIASSVLKYVLRNPVNVSTDPNNNIHRQAALYQFKSLEEIPSIKSPKFVFVHVLLPHDPFVFDQKCTPISEKVVKQNSHQVNYLNQLQCVNTQIKKILDDVLKKSKNPPIIILQSDEGPFPMNSSVDSNQSWGSATDTALREKFPIMNAYYFPGVDYEDTQLYKEISPVNSFKVLFNTYFGTDHELVEDKSYIYEDKFNYYKFKDVTDIVR